MNLHSEHNDVVNLGEQYLKTILNNKISIGYYGTDKDKLGGYYIFDNDSDKIIFNIEYNKDSYLRLSVCGSTYERRMKVVSILSDLLSTIPCIGNPLAFYTIGDNNEEIYFDWAFNNVNSFINELEHNTMYSDKSINNLNIFKRLGRKAR